MARYIDADALIVRLLDYAAVNRGNYWSAGFKNAVTVVEMEETADVVKVVRCKDCKHSSPKVHICEITNYMYGANYFCAWGERRDDAVF